MDLDSDGSLSIKRVESIQLSPTASFSGLRKRSAAAQHLAQAEAVTQVQNLGIHETEHDRAALSLHKQSQKAFLQDAHGNAEITETIKSREENELHRSVNKLMNEAGELRKKLKGETQMRLAAEEKVHTQELLLIEASQEIDALKAKMRSLELRNDSLAKENQRLRDEMEQEAPKALSIAPAIMRVVSQKSFRAMRNTGLNLLQWCEAIVRGAIESESAAWELTVEAQKSTFTRSAKIESDLVRLTRENERLRRIENEQTLSVVTGKIGVTDQMLSTALEDLRRREIVLDEASTRSRFIAARIVFEHDLHRSMDTVKSHTQRVAPSSVSSRRSVSPRLHAMDKNPWVPPGNGGVGFHISSPYTHVAVARAHTTVIPPVFLPRNPLRQKSPSPSPSSNLPQPTPRRTIPVPTAPSPQGSAGSVQPDSKSPHSPTPQRYSSSKSPRRHIESSQALSKTVESMQALLVELQRWQ